MAEELDSRMSSDVPEDVKQRLNDIASAPYAVANGIEIISISKDEVALRMSLKGKENSIGIGHGAATFLLADHTFAFATNMGEHSHVAINCNINYLKPAKGDRLRSVSRIVRAGRNISVIQVDVFDDDELVAIFQGTSHRV